MRFDSLESALNSMIHDGLLTVNVSIPCVVDKYQNGRVWVTPVVMRVTKEGSEKHSTIPDVPVAYPNGGGYSITFPIEKGDEGLIIFSQRDISQFKEKGGIADPPTYRIHSMADAIFIPAMVRSTEEHVDLTITDGSAEIKMKNGRIDLNGQVFINGGRYSLHNHTLVQAGTDVSGPVSPL